MVISCEKPYRLSESVCHLCEDSRIRRRQDGIKMAAPLHFTLLVAGQGSRKKWRPFNWGLREHDDPFYSHSRAIIILVVYMYTVHTVQYTALNFVNSETMTYFYR
jgi:hypothetical protein